MYYKETNTRENYTTVFQTHTETWWWEYSGIQVPIKRHSILQRHATPSDLHLFQRLHCDLWGGSFTLLTNAKWMYWCSSFLPQSKSRAG